MHDIDRGLSLQDLVLLMDAYKNNIELTTTAMDQIKQILFQQDKILDSQKDLCKEIINTTNVMRDFSSSMVEKISDIDKDIMDVKLEVIKENSSLRNVMYIFLAGSIALITSIVSLTIDLSKRYILIEKIAIFLGISLQ